MAQRLRHAAPGTWHHVYNRGIGKRLIFGNRSDYRQFMALMACAVRRGEIEIHAFCLLGTHFHILCRVPENGDLSKAMMRIQNAYTRWFNRRNRRDGPLFRGRFRSKLVDTDSYWLTLLRYIDFNAVSARICSHPAAYEFGSAHAYYTGAAPRWLRTKHARALVLARGYPDLGAGYRALIGRTPSPEERELVDLRLRGPTGEDPTDDLLRLAAPGFRDWVVWKARNADGLKPSLPLASIGAVEREIGEHRDAVGGLSIRGSRKKLDAAKVLRAGMLHEFAGCSCELVAHRLGCGSGTASRWIRLHRTALNDDKKYADVVSTIFKAALKRAHGLRR